MIPYDFPDKSNLAYKIYDAVLSNKKIGSKLDHTVTKKSNLCVIMKEKLSSKEEGILEDIVKNLSPDDDHMDIARRSAIKRNRLKKAFAKEALDDFEAILELSNISSSKDPEITAAINKIPKFLEKSNLKRALKELSELPGNVLIEELRERLQEKIECMLVKLPPLESIEGGKIA